MIVTGAHSKPWPCCGGTAPVVLRLRHQRVVSSFIRPRTPVTHGYETTYFLDLFSAAKGNLLEPPRIIDRFYSSSGTFIALCYIQ